mgnify:CR=1 FL=1
MNTFAFIKRKKFAKYEYVEVPQPVRAYAPRNGDIFTIDDRHVLEVLRHSNSHHIFLPLRRYRKVIWYRPWTWFRRFWDIQYIEFEEGGEDDGSAVCSCVSANGNEDDESGSG